MKDGLFLENGELVYYRFDVPCHAGLIETEDGIYYIGKGGKAVTGEYVIHKEMTNGILPHGTYRFGEDCRLIDGYYVRPKRTRTTKKRGKRMMSDGTKLILLSIVAIVIVGLLVLLGVTEPTPTFR